MYTLNLIQKESAVNCNLTTSWKKELDLYFEKRGSVAG